MKKAAVIGGGITGLTAAFYIQKTARDEGLPLEITVYEASDHLGGKIQTIHQDDFVIERGADSFLARKQPGMDLMKALGLEDKLYRNETGQSYVLVHNELKQIPAGSFMGIPVQEEPFMNSDIVSEAGKKRALDEVNVPKGQALQDQALGAFLRRRFGDELVDHLLAPLLSGIYSSSIDEMSLMASFPNFYELEQTYGSVLRGLRETMPERTGTGKKAGQFVSMEGGLTSIVEGLEQALGSNIRKSTGIQRIEQKEGGYLLHDVHGEIHEADAVILALPHKIVPALFEDTQAFLPINDIPVKSVANVALTFNAEDIDQVLDGTGFVVSQTSDVRITACTWTHKKWPATTPPGKALLRTYVGRPADQEIVQKSDDEIIAIVMQDLKKTMGIEVKPEFAVITRWEDLMPQYTVGHTARVEELEQAIISQYPGLYLAGASYHGVGLPDCIGQAKQIQETVMEYLKK